MSQTLRYQISDWSQITACLSNNSKNLKLSLLNYTDGDNLRGLVLQVKHNKYGVLFAALIKGAGTILDTKDEEGQDLPFLTTDEILREIQRFGFYVTYDVKANLPMDTITFLSTIDNLGFDKITKVYVTNNALDGYATKSPVVIAFKSSGENMDLIKYGATIGFAKFNEKLFNNTVINISHEDDIQWDWLSYTANIRDILSENLTSSEEYEEIPSFSDDEDTFDEIDVLQENNLIPDISTVTTEV